jgi:hypothetical protein
MGISSYFLSRTSIGGVISSVGMALGIPDQMPICAVLTEHDATVALVVPGVVTSSFIEG